MINIFHDQCFSKMNRFVKKMSKKLALSLLSHDPDNITLILLLLLLHINK